MGKAAPLKAAVTLLYIHLAHQSNDTTQNRPRLFTTVLPDVKQVSSPRQPWALSPHLTHTAAVSGLSHTSSPPNPAFPYL